MIKTYGGRGDSLLGRRVKHEIATNNNGIISSKNIPCESKFVLEHTTALCSYYAEEGGMILGFQGAFNSYDNPSLFK